MVAVSDLFVLFLMCCEAVLKFILRALGALRCCCRYIYDCLCRQEEEERPFIDDENARHETQTKRARIKELQDAIAQKERDRDELLRQTEHLKRMYFPRNGQVVKLSGQSNTFKPGIDELKNMYGRMIKSLLGEVKKHLEKLLTAPKEKPTSRSRREHDQKEQYKVYGLLLSAVGARDDESLGHREKLTEVMRKLQRDYVFIRGSDQSVIVKNIEKALELCRSMLILLPPLLVCQPSWYNENLQDTNRLTWDETKPSGPLFYYCPVLVYGNSLQVAVKGRVGNSKTDVTVEDLINLK